MSIPIVEWVSQKPSFNTSATDYLPRIVLDVDGNTIVCYCTDMGYTSGQTLTGKVDIVVFKLDQNDGSCVWTTQKPAFNTSEYDYYPQIVTDQSGDIYICYCTDGSVSGYSNQGAYDVVVFKLDGTTGNCIWTTQNPIFNTSLNDINPQMTIDTNDHLYVSIISAGHISGNTSSLSGSNIAVFRINSSDGTCQWVVQQPCFNSGDDNSQHIAVDSSGDIYVCYYTSLHVSGQSSSGGTDIVVFKLQGSTGQWVWTVQRPTFNTNLNEADPKITADHLGNVLVMYTTTGITSGQTQTGSRDVVVCKLDKNNGSCLWVAQQPSFNSDYVNGWYYNLVIDSDNNVCCVYTTYYGVVSGQTATGWLDQVVFKLASQTGQCLWCAQQPTFNSDNYNSYQQIALDKDDQVYVTYTVYGVVSGQTSTGGLDIVVFKLDKSSGDCLWVIQSPLFNTSLDEDLYFSVTQNNLQNMVIDSNGRVYVTYMTYGTTSGQTHSGDSDIVVCKLGQPFLSFDIYQGTPSTISVGAPVTYQYLVKNVGNTPITNIVIIDSLGISVTLDQTILLPDESAMGQATYLLTQTDLINGYINSSSTVQGHYGTYLITADRKTTVVVTSSVRPSPPRHFYGRIRYCHHPKHNRPYVLTTRWHHSHDANVVHYYEILHHNKIIALTPKLKWRKHLRSHKYKKIYIKAVSFNGLKSKRTKLRIKQYHILYRKMKGK